MNGSTPMTTTLTSIRKHGPCADGWKKLLAHLGKTKDDDDPLPMTVILDSNGLDDALWCLRAEPQHERAYRLYAVWCAKQVRHLMSDQRSLDALEVAERHANGEASDSELDAAWSAAYDYATSAASAAASAAAAAAAAAARAAYAAAASASAAARTAAASAARASAAAAKAAAARAAATAAWSTAYVDAAATYAKDAAGDEQSNLLRALFETGDIDLAILSVMEATE